MIIKPNAAHEITKTARRAIKDKEDQIENNRKEAQLFQARLDESYKETLQELFELALKGESSPFFVKDEFSWSKSNRLERCGFVVEYLLADRAAQAKHQAKYDKLRGDLLELLAKLDDFPGIMTALFPECNVSSLSLEFWLNEFWKSGALNERSFGRHLLELLKKQTGMAGDTIDDSLPLLDLIVSNYVFLRFECKKLKKISSVNTRVPDDCDGGIRVLLKTPLSSENLDGLSVLSQRGLSWIASNDGQKTLSRIMELISKEATNGSASVRIPLFKFQKFWTSPFIMHYLLQEVIDEDGCVHEEETEIETEAIYLPSPAFLSELLRLIGYEAKVFDKTKSEIYSKGTTAERYLLQVSW